MCRRAVDGSLVGSRWRNTLSGRRRRKTVKESVLEERNEQRLSLPTPLPDDDVEILWNELVEHDGELIEEWEDELEDPQEVTTEKLQQGAANKGNEKGSNVHGKSLIWAAKRHLREEGAVRILTGGEFRESKVSVRQPAHFKSFCCDASWPGGVQGSLVSAEVSGP